MARTPYVLKPFVNIQPSSGNASDDPQMLVDELKRMDAFIEFVKKKKEEFIVDATELESMNHPDAQIAWSSVKQADNILNDVVAMRHKLLNRA
jgi:hypothetical protein